MNNQSINPTLLYIATVAVGNEGDRRPYPAYNEWNGMENLNEGGEETRDKDSESESGKRKGNEI